MYLCMYALYICIQIVRGDIASECFCRDIANAGGITMKVYEFIYLCMYIYTVILKRMSILYAE
jgi:hypothetical protein